MADGKTMISPFSTDLIGWLRILYATIPGVLAMFGGALAFMLAVWAGVELCFWRKR